MINELPELYPDIIKMIQIYKLKDIKQEYKDVLFNNFSILHQTIITYGHIHEELYENLVSCPDTNYTRKVAPKHVGISQEMWHCAKVLYHDQ